MAFGVCECGSLLSSNSHSSECTGPFAPDPGSRVPEAPRPQTAPGLGGLLVALGDHRPVVEGGGWKGQPDVVASAVWSLMVRVPRGAVALNWGPPDRASVVCALHPPQPPESAVAFLVE